MAMTVGIFILLCARAAAIRTSCEGTSSANGSSDVHLDYHHGGMCLPIWLAETHSWNGTSVRDDNNDIYANPAQFHRGGDEKQRVGCAGPSIVNGEKFSDFNEV